LDSPSFPKSFAILFLVVGAVLVKSWADPLPAKPGPQTPSSEQIVQIQAELRNLLDQLEEIDELHDQAQRQPLIARHWQAVQAYMHEIQDLLPPAARAHADLLAFGSAAECRLSPAINADGYVSRMRDVLWAMRERLADAYSTKDPARRLQTLDDLSRSAYQAMQLIRSFGWMNGSAAPVALEHEPITDSASEPAYLVRRYCGQCHAPPQATLHSANEWSTVASKMSDHMRIANSTNPEEVAWPDAKALTMIVTYLEANGCETTD